MSLIWTNDKMKNKFKISSPFLSDFIPENIWEIFWICLPYSLRLYQEDVLNLFTGIYCGHIWSKFKIYTLDSFKIWSQFLPGEYREEIKNIHFNINREQILNVTFPIWKYIFVYTYKFRRNGLTESSSSTTPIQSHEYNSSWQPRS